MVCHQWRGEQGDALKITSHGVRLENQRKSFKKGMIILRYDSFMTWTMVNTLILIETTQYLFIKQNLEVLTDKERNLLVMLTTLGLLYRSL